MISVDETVMDSVVGHAVRAPERQAVVFVSGASDPLLAESLSYAELDLGARAVAAYLQSQIEPGDRVLVMHQSGIDFAKSFVGCLYAGAVPIACPLPGGSGHHHLARATGIALDAGSRVALTDPAHLPIVHEWADQDGLGRIGCLSTDATADLAPTRWRPPLLTAESVAVLQYTSMAGGDHRGVALSHRNLADNAARAARLLGWQPGTRLCNWFPFHHATSLIAFLEALLLGATTVQMEPAGLARHPSTWLEIIDRYRADVAIAPDACYELCTRRVSDEELARLDLSRWRQAVDIGRPARAKTIGEFSGRFAAAGFRPEAFVAGYGLAEATMIVTGGPVCGPPRVLPACVENLRRGRLVAAEGEAGGLELVAHGPVDGSDIRIVDPVSRTVRPEGAVGEVWVRGSGVAGGYWRSDPERDQVFEATTAEGERGFLRTGDLGAVHAGELYLVGKLDKRLVIGGRMIHPEEIEHQVRRLGGLLGQRIHRVFTIPLRGGEIAVALELDTAADPDVVTRLKSIVRARLARRSGPPVADVVIVECGTLCGLSGGGLSHELMCHLFAADALVPLIEDPERAAGLGHRRVPTGPPLPAHR
ncbi:polyketide synthase [Actinomadura sp. NBRC 104412]|uniref:AMP-binding protein n=1 Tax=Actinomadura sp. NBRC 104412 TaxID=3032203 RepID=UPI0024A338E1|nr:AMP-binding protein [Actinomadura sp. NBRC 104412]GLZ06493.1 polyketide synthase [Actinomadura sp. NBRC 104412]